VADLLLEFDHRQEEVGVEVEPGVEDLEQFDLLGAVVPTVAYSAANDRPVLLLDVGAVIPSPEAATSEGSLLLEAVAIELLVDEFRATVGVDAQQGEGQALTCPLDGGENVDLGLVADGETLRPAGFDVCDAQSPGMLMATGDLASAVVDQVDLAEAWAVFGPVGPGTDLDPLFEQAAGLGESTSTSLAMAMSSPEAIHGGRAHLEEVLVAGEADAEDSGLVQPRQLDVQGHTQAFRADVVEEIRQERMGSPSCAPYRARLGRRMGPRARRRLPLSTAMACLR